MSNKRANLVSEYLKYLYENPLIEQEVFHPHDELACRALLEYDNRATFLESTGRQHQVTPSLMREIAAQNGTTTDAMKKHWACIKQIRKNAKEPNGAILKISRNETGDMNEEEIKSILVHYGQYCVIERLIKKDTHEFNGYRYENIIPWNADRDWWVQVKCKINGQLIMLLESGSVRNVKIIV